MKKEWKIETRKNGTEVYVECEDYSIFIGEGYGYKELANSLAIASVIEKALNEYEEEYECHDKGTNAHFDEMSDDQAFIESTGGRN
tara:strand:- start:86 stop:343 length:258 start_codon:yes stop_codon:yes gene_type:complete